MFSEAGQQPIKNFQKMGNPFKDDFPELVSLDSRICVDASVVVVALRTLEETGIKHYKDLLKMIWKNAFNLFIILPRRIFLLSSKDLIPRQHPKQVRRSKVLPNNVALFGQLYISM